jgi:hypothetical protein
MHSPKKVDADFLHRGIRSSDLEVIRELAKNKGLAEEVIVEILEAYHSKWIEEGEVKPSAIATILKNHLRNLLAQE